MASTGSEATPNEEAQCSKCNKKQSELTIPLKRCAKCQTCLYCSRDCQKADWKTHKKSCGTTTSQNGGSGGSSSSSTNPFTAIQENRFFDNKPEDEAFAHIIDSYRLRVEDEYTFMGKHRGIYNQEHPRADFNAYLNKAEAAGVLPKWWNAQKREACVAYGFNKANWSDLNCAVEKSDVIEHYKNPMMPMLLRMVTEMVEGSNVTGQPAGAGLRAMSFMHEQSGVSSLLDMSGGFR